LLFAVYYRYTHPSSKFGTFVFPLDDYKDAGGRVTQEQLPRGLGEEIQTTEF
jgi:hypothetical protein